MVLRLHWSSQPWVHPRIRGEDLISFGVLMSNRGSPPHTRGRLEKITLEALLRRFTPAYAGKIKFLLGSSVQSEVHPRIRGEDAITAKRG